MDDRSLPASFQEVLIPSLPASGYYVPNFITETEEAYLLQKVKYQGGGVSPVSHASLLAAAADFC